MSRGKLLSGDYFKLFVKREGKVVLGKGYSNLWLLTAVLALTFLAISFSNASLEYLSYKMDDPFINWVDIQNDYGEGDIDGLLYGLADTTNKARYHFIGHQVDYSNHYMFFGKKESQIQYLACRFFQSFDGNPLVAAILDKEKDNVVNNATVDPSLLRDNMIGMIVTQDAMRKLGYENEFPAFIDLCRYSEGADTLGFKLYQDKFAHVPIPVLAVVRRLPMNMDIISTRYFYEQQRNDATYPFNLNNRQYACELNYYVPATVDCREFRDFLGQTGGKDTFVGSPDMSYMCSFKSGNYVSLSGMFDELSPSAAAEIDAAVMDRYASKDVHRVFNYDFSDYTLPMGSFVSVQFRDLSCIRDFESFVKDTYKVRIEMSQINAKENFNAVSVMANILSWAIIVFSIICIILFVVNLLQSYFQKVKRNMGTFKAFGISNRELISVYVLIMLSTIIGAIAVSLIITLLIQYALPVFSIMKDGTFNYLDLWSSKTLYSILIIIASSVATVFLVMKRQLSATPGDLIYDRQ